MSYSGGANIPVVVDRLDDEAEGGADSVDIFTHYPLDNGGFACIVKASTSTLAWGIVE